MKFIPLIEEQEVLERVVGGDARAFDKLYYHYSPPLYWKLKNMVKDEEEAKEILQDVFVRLWERRVQLEPEKSLIAYLHLIARNKVIDHYRKVTLTNTAYSYIKSESSELTSNTEETIQVNETQMLLDQAVDLLPPQQKLAFRLCKIEGKTSKEASEIMNISHLTVNNHLAKATSSVKEYLIAREHVLPAIILFQIISNL